MNKEGGGGRGEARVKTMRGEKGREEIRRGGRKEEIGGDVEREEIKREEKRVEEREVEKKKGERREEG